MLALLLSLAAAQDLARPPFDAARAQDLRREWAAALKVEPEIRNGAGMTLLLIPGGRFEMGVKGAKYGVELKQAYYLGRTEVTNAQYRRFKPEHRVTGAAEEFEADDIPVAAVSWQDARDYAAWLSERPEEKAAGRRYALPTEAQWEWAARAGTVAPRYGGETPAEVEAVAWFNHAYTPNPKSEGAGRGRHPVGRLQPNAWGLHDLYGNVWEWCEDRRVDPATGETRDPVMRGGGWRSGGSHCTSESRDPGAPTLRVDHVGFRLACSLPR